MSEIAEFFSLDDFAILATYHSVYDLPVILDDETVTLFDDEIDTSQPMVTCEQARLVLDGDTDYRDAIGRTLVLPPFDLFGQSFNEDKTYTIRRALPDGTGVCQLMLSKNG